MNGHELLGKLNALSKEKLNKIVMMEASYFDNSTAEVVSVSIVDWHTLYNKDEVIRLGWDR